MKTSLVALNNINYPNWSTEKKRLEKKNPTGDFLVVQWLRLWPSNAGGVGLMPGQGITILHASLRGLRRKTQQTQWPVEQSQAI